MDTIADMTALQALLTNSMPTERPAEIPLREWQILVGHVQYGRTIKELAGQVGLSPTRASKLAQVAAFRLVTSGRFELPVTVHDRSGRIIRRAEPAAPSTSPDSPDSRP
jgi:hypothetical protein